MIKLIGTKRLIALAVLASLNATMAAGTYLYLMPQNEKLDREFKQIKSQISSKRSEADRFRQEFEEIQQEKGNYQSLEAQGFMGDQSRQAARKRIDAIQSYSRVLSAKYNIMPGEASEVETAREADRVIVQSPMSFDIEALDDADVFQFAYLIENAFMGHTAVTSFELERAIDLNDVTLRQIGTGIPAVLVKSKMVLNWKTLMKREDAVMFGASVTAAQGR
ncbi:MAG: hypothetical protein ACK4NR_06245 [Micavibrio sp.]